MWRGLARDVRARSQAEADVMQLELGSSFKLVGEVLEALSVGTGEGEEEDGGWRALYALALTGRWKCGQGEEEDGPWVVKVRTESCHWIGMSGPKPLRPVGTGKWRRGLGDGEGMRSNGFF